MPSISFRTKMIFIVAFSCFLCAVISFFSASHYENKALHEGIVQRSFAIHDRLDAATAYVANQGGLKTIIHQMTQKYKTSDEITKEDKEQILKQVPIYAAMQIGKKDSEKSFYDFRIFSNEPRNEENKATQEEMEVFNKFEKDKNLDHYISDNGATITVYKPVRLSKDHGCMNCHGDPATSPWKNGRDILGYKMENWQDGKLHGVFAVTTEVDKIVAFNSKNNLVSNSVAIGSFIGIGSVLAIFFAFFNIKGPVAKITNTIVQLRETGASLLGAANEVTDTSSQLSQAAVEQASSLEQTSASVEQLSSMIQKNTENALRSADSSRQGQESAEHGQGSVTAMIQAMEEISQSNQTIMNEFDETNKRLAEIVVIIKEIATKTKVINDIVFQTKLLSFNASVEAARAGEQGKGFAVVAEEVGNLAAMSGNAADEISTMLETSISRVEQTVTESKVKIESLILNSKSKVNNGMKTAEECKIALEEIVASINSISSMSQEISLASQEQASGVREIAKATNELNTITQQNTSASETVSVMAKSLNDHALVLDKAVDEIISVMEGKKV